MNPFSKNSAMQHESKTVNRADGEAVAGPAMDRRDTVGRAFSRVVIYDQAQLSPQQQPSYLQYPKFHPQEEYAYGAQPALDHLVGQAAASEAVSAPAPADPDETFLSDMIPGAAADMNTIGVERPYTEADAVAEAEAITRQAAAARATQGDGSVSDAFFAQNFGMAPRNLPVEAPAAPPTEIAPWNVPVEADMAGPQVPENVRYWNGIQPPEPNSGQRAMQDDAYNKLADIYGEAA